MKTIRCLLTPISRALPLVLLWVSPVSAQTVVGDSASRLSEIRTESNSARPAASSVASALAAGAPLIQRGPVGVRPHVVYRAIYGEGIEAGPGNQHDSVIQSLSPGVLFDLGKYWHLDYTPTWTFYSNEAFRDTASQSAVLSGRVPYDRLTLGAAQSYDSSYALLVETGRQTHQTTYSSLIEGIYRLGDHTRLESNASRSARYANAVTDAPEWTTSDWVQWSSTNWLRYEFSPRLEAAVGLGLGYAEIGAGSDMSFLLPQARLVWKPFDKIALTAQAGEESRKFEDGGRPRLKSPVYTASASYQLFPTTKLSTDFSRAVSASYFANEITKTQGWSVGLEQRFVQRLYLSASLGEQKTAYLATRSALLVERDDKYRAFNARLTTVVLHRVSFALLYQTGRNSSDDAAYVFNSSQYGLELGVQF